MKEPVADPLPIFIFSRQLYRDAPTKSITGEHYMRHWEIWKGLIVSLPLNKAMNSIKTQLRDM